MRSVLITGAAGFVGSHAVEVFREAGWKIRATDRPGTDSSVILRSGAEFRPADLRDPAQIPALLEGVDTVVHLAAFFDFALRRRVLYDANVVTTENLCAASVKAGLQSFVHLSTVGVYGAPRRLPCDEGAPKHPQNAYEETKWIAEQSVMRFHREQGLPVRAIRPTLIYGPRNRGGFSLIFGLMSMMVSRRGFGMPLITKHPISHFVHAEDVARGCLHLAMMKGGLGEAYNVADDQPVQIGDFFTALQRALGARHRVRFIPWWMLRAWSRNAMAVPRQVLGLVNDYFAREWKKLQERHDLYRGFMPRLDRDWFEYMLADHFYSTDKLKATGFTLKHPDVMKGVEEMVRWYCDNRWIPPVREPRRPAPAPELVSAAR